MQSNLIGQLEESSIADVLLKGSTIVVPSTVRLQVRQIQDMIENCKICAKHPQKRAEPLIPTPEKEQLFLKCCCSQRTSSQGEGVESVFPKCRGSGRTSSPREAVGLVFPKCRGSRRTSSPREGVESVFPKCSGSRRTSSPRVGVESVFPKCPHLRRTWSPRETLE